MMVLEDMLSITLGVIGSSVEISKERANRKRIARRSPMITITMTSNLLFAVYYLRFA